MCELLGNLVSRNSLSVTIPSLPRLNCVFCLRYSNQMAYLMIWQRSKNVSSFMKSRIKQKLSLHSSPVLGNPVLNWDYNGLHRKNVVDFIWNNSIFKARGGGKKMFSATRGNNCLRKRLLLTLY